MEGPLLPLPEVPAPPPLLEGLEGLAWLLLLLAGLLVGLLAEVLFPLPLPLPLGGMKYCTTRFMTFTIWDTF